MGNRRKNEVLRLVIESIGDREIHYGPDALVSDLIEAFDRSADSQSLRIERTGRVLSPDLKLLAAGLCSGDRVVLVDIARTAHIPVDEQVNAATATLEMLSGPLKGSVYSLRSGTSTIGRVAANDLVIVDPGISRQHAIVTVDQTSVTIVDNGSTNGIKVDGRPIIEPTQVDSGKPILVGQSLMAITHHPPLDSLPSSGAVPLERQSRQIYRFDEQVITLPVPPDPATKRRRTERLSNGRSRHRLAVEHFHASVAAIDQRLEEGRKAETASRFYEAPSVTEVHAGSDALWRLWERRALDPDGLEVRLGIGTMPSRTDLRLPDGGDPELRALVAEIPERYRLIPGLPAVVDFRRFGSIGLSGATKSVDHLAYSIVTQLAWFHGPDQLGLVCAPGSGAASWDWLKWLPHLVHSGSGDLDSGFGRWLSAVLDGTPTSFIDPSKVGATEAQNNGIGPMSELAPEPGPRPPAIVVVLDREHSLSKALMARLVSEGPALGVYTLALWGDQPESGFGVGAAVSVGVETANIDSGSGEHIGGINIESIDLEIAVDMARLMSPIRYAEELASDEPADDEVERFADSGESDVESADGVVVASFELGDVGASRVRSQPGDGDGDGDAGADVEGDIASEVGTEDVEPGPEVEPFEPEPVDPESDPNDAFVIDAEFVDSSTEPETEPEEGVAQVAAPAAPTMPQRPPSKPQLAYRLIETLPHGDDASRLMLGTIHTEGRAAPAVFAWNLSRDGSLGLAGGPGSGKTSALHSIVASAALLRVDSAEVPLIYYLDVRGQLEEIEVLPNCVGAVRNDIDGFRSTAADLDQELDRRAESGSTERRILVAIDEVDSFVELMDSLEPGQAEALLQRLVDDGPALGMHLVMTVGDRDEVSETVASSVGRWLTLGSTAGVAKIGKNEIRFAPIADEADGGIATALGSLAEQLIERGVTGPAEAD